MKINSVKENPQNFKGGSIQYIKKGGNYFQVGKNGLLKQVDSKTPVISSGFYTGRTSHTTVEAYCATPADYFPKLTAFIKNIANKLHITKEANSSHGVHPSLAKA